MSTVRHGVWVGLIMVLAFLAGSRGAAALDTGYLNATNRSAGNSFAGPVAIGTNAASAMLTAGADMRIDGSLTVTGALSAVRQGELPMGGYTHGVSTAGLLPVDTGTAPPLNNVVLHSYRMAEQGGWARIMLVGGMVDAFETATGINTGACAWTVYEAGEGCYTPYAPSGGIDSNTVLMLHCDGTDGATSFPDDSPSAHAVTAYYTARVDTNAVKWGSGSLELDGNSDFLQANDSADWDLVASTATDYTIDLWVKHDNHAGTETYLTQKQYDNIFWTLRHGDGNGSAFQAYNTDRIINCAGAHEITDSEWHHVALVKLGTTFAIYVDGNQGAYIVDGSTKNYSGPLRIGRRNWYGNTSYFDGHMDEIRIQKSNWFGADPQSDHSDTITVPVAPYSETAATVSNLALVGTAVAASTVPDAADVTVFEEDIDPVTLNTDINAYVSRDGGTTFSAAVLLDLGVYENGRRMLSGTAPLSEQPDGTNMVWKITTHNGRNLRIHGVGMTWE